jgi:8-oxo-dGTP diphosphatase
MTTTAASRRRARRMPAAPQIRYTLVFAVHRGSVLLVRRVKPPHVGFRNGLGGKIEPNELPEDGALRELREESGIDARVAGATVRYVGLATWDHCPTPGGMHVYAVEMPEAWERPWEAIDTREGEVAWTAADLLDDAELADHARPLVDASLAGAAPQRFHCRYARNAATPRLRSIDTAPLALAA